MTPSKAKDAAEAQRTMAQLGMGAERPNKGSDFGFAVGVILIFLAIGFFVWWLRIIPGWHP